MDKQQTAVEWYAGKVHDLQVAKDFGAISVTEYYEELTKAVQQAKKMQKNQMIAFAEESINYLNNKDCRLLTHFDRIEDFYNTKYGK